MVFLKNPPVKRLWIAWSKGLESFVKLMSKNCISAVIHTSPPKDSDPHFSLATIGDERYRLLWKNIVRLSLDFCLNVLFLRLASIHSLSEFRWQIVIISANQWADDRLSLYKPLFSLLMVLTQSEASTSQNGRCCMLTAVRVQQYSIKAEVIALIALTANLCVCFNHRENK